MVIAFNFRFQTIVLSVWLSTNIYIFPAYTALKSMIRYDNAVRVK